MRYFQYFVLLISAVGATVFADETVPGRPQKSPIALVGGTVHPIQGPAIENATIIFDAGKIVAVGQGIEVPADAEVILVDGKHIYPGMFESHTQLGLKELDSVRASIDQSEVGNINPNVLASVALNPDSSLLPVTRANGVLLALSAPIGGLVSGQAAVIQLDGWTHEDLTLDAHSAMVVNWPGPPGRGRRGGRGTPTPPTTDPLAELKKLVDETRRYQDLRTAQPEQQPVDLRLEAMSQVTSRKIPILVAADSLSQIESAVAFAVREDFRLIILGGYDAAECADLLKRHDIPVVITAVHRVPQGRSDAYDASYTLPARLQAAGVRFCISGSGRSESWNSRNLPYHAATAVAFGLEADQAMRSITLSPAEIFGVANRVGSLEVGKDATLIVTDGIPLEIPTQTEIAYIQGRRLDLSNKHTRLRDKYLQKYDEK
ncbi:MAG: amidohydrolase family protein [Pirellulaceae bacterium]|nr:amidohydrolase family protein [Pirellulaceae bacterium]